MPSGRAPSRSVPIAATTPPTFVEELRMLKARPHVAQNTKGRRSAIDRRTMRHPRLRRQAEQPPAQDGKSVSVGQARRARPWLSRSTAR